MRIVVMGLLVLAIVGCQNNEGCTNQNSVNYSSSAQQDDGSCTYEAYVVFGFLDQTADQLNTMGIYSVDFYLDGVFIGSKSTSQSWYITDDTDCLDPNEVAETINLGSSPTSTAYYEARDSNGNVLDSRTFSHEGATCRTIFVDL